MPIRHIIASGETTSSLAYAFGFSPHTIWNDPDNAELRKKRHDMNILMPGDVIVIPDKQLREVSAGTEMLHRFVLQNTPALFRLQLYQSDGRPRCSQDYLLSVDGKSYSGTTDQQGILQEYISPQAKKGKIILMPQLETIDLRFGALNPVTEDSGVRQRLTNLGFACGSSQIELKSALTAFQKECGLSETGDLDEATRQRLERLHDTVSDYPTDQNSEGAGI